MVYVCTKTLISSNYSPQQPVDGAEKALRNINPLTATTLRGYPRNVPQSSLFTNLATVWHTHTHTYACQEAYFKLEYNLSDEKVRLVIWIH